MVNVVSAAVLADIIDEIYSSDKNPLGKTHKRHYVEARNDDGTYVSLVQRNALDGNRAHRI